MTNPHKSPLELGYRWPAEWEPHAATWLAWPHKAATWPGRLAEATSEFVELARTIASFEQVHVLAGGQLEQARALLGKERDIELWDIPTNDAWVRDYGPIFLKRGAETLVVDWQYNAWGNKYPPYADDNAVAPRIAASFGLPSVSVPMVLEGGSVEGNGQGCIMTTRTCLLNPNRNPQCGREAIEANLLGYLGGEQLIWLEGEIEGDDTDGHIDQLARFIAPATVAVASEHDPADANYTALADLRAELVRAKIGTTAVTLVELPMPSPLYHGDQRLPASYANFYMANDLVVVPHFGDPHDQRALHVLREYFANRSVVGLPCRELVWGLGGFHCLTASQPA